MSREHLEGADVTLTDKTWDVLNCDALEGLRALPANMFQAVVTSPPYWKLRSYKGVSPTRWGDGSECLLGMEPTPEKFIAHLVEVFEGVRRVLRDDGVLFCNLGDSYNAGTSTERKPSNGNRGNDVGRWQQPGQGNLRTDCPGLKPGDKCGIPERFALAMQAAGWFWRDTIIWHKPAPMPSSQNGWRWERCKVKDLPTPREYKGHERLQNGRAPDGRQFAASEWSDCPGCDKCRQHNGLILRRAKFRTTTAHEPIFMFAKSERYFADAESSRKPCLASSTERMKSGFNSAKGDDENHYGDGFQRGPGYELTSRIPRSVWRISGQVYRLRRDLTAEQWQRVLAWLSHLGV